MMTTYSWTLRTVNQLSDWGQAFVFGNTYTVHMNMSDWVSVLPVSKVNCSTQIARAQTHSWSVLDLCREF